MATLARWLGKNANKSLSIFSSMVNTVEAAAAARKKTEEEKTRRQIEQEKQSAAPFTIVHINQGANEV